MCYSQPKNRERQSSNTKEKNALAALCCCVVNWCVVASRAYNIMRLKFVVRLVQLVNKCATGDPVFLFTSRALNYIGLYKYTYGWMDFFLFLLLGLLLCIQPSVAVWVRPWPGHRCVRVAIERMCVEVIKKKYRPKTWKPPTTARATIDSIWTTVFQNSPFYVLYFVTLWRCGCLRLWQNYYFRF